MITLVLTEEHVQIIWGLLGEAPLKVSLPVYKAIEQQIAEQKAPPPPGRGNGTDARKGTQ